MWLLFSKPTLGSLSPHCGQITFVISHSLAGVIENMISTSRK
ncbi:MAG: hypothetical protein SPJ23_09055 [Eubacteriales bacterium]|nr:hypothetical protein [Eubacteriales bacterium]